MKSAPRLGSTLEVLEDRALPSTFGVPWADAEHLTLSFANDGTPTPLGASSLSQLLNSAGSNAAKVEILRAFQTWAAQANINIGLVSDGGQALGTTGAVQGDARFGDIRIAAAGLSPDVLASASPFSWTGTTLSGDVILNASAPFGIGTANDLYSVLVHEAGHTFGMDHSTAPGSVMNETYTYHAGLSATDIAAIQALYGARRADAYDAAGGNDTVAKASAIPRSTTSQLLASGDLTTMADVDYYKFTAPALTSMLSAVTVRLKASGLSLLTASVTVYDSAGRVVASGSSVDPLNNDITLTFRPGLFGGNYTIKVEGARGDVFDIGAYKLAVDFLSLGGLLSPITTTLVGVLDGGTNDLLSNALGLQSNASGTDARFDAVYRGVIETPSDVDSYRVSTDKYAPGTAVTLNVMVWGLDANPVDTRVRVFDSAGNPVAFQVLSNDRGLFSVQVLNAVAGKDYFVQVSAREGAVKNTGSYFFAADFNQIVPLVFDNVANGTAAAGVTTAADQLTITEAGLFQFALGAEAQRAGDAVTMTVYDANGTAVLTLTAIGGRPPVTAGRYLNAGTYTVKYTAAQTNIAPVSYRLFLLQLSEGVGPYATSTATPPSSTAPGTTAPMPPPPASTTTTTDPNTPTTSPTSTTTNPTTYSAPPPSSPPTSTTTTTSSGSMSSATTQESSYSYSAPYSMPPSGYWYTY